MVALLAGSDVRRGLSGGSLPVAVVLLALQLGCGGGGGGSGGGDGGGNGGGGSPAGTNQQGSVRLPDGVAAADLRITNSVGDATVDAAGGYTVAGYGQRHLAMVTTAAGVPYLAGWVGTDGETISARSTAEVLYFFASGLCLIPAAEQARVIAMLPGVSDLEPLARAIEDALRRNPGVGLGDPAVKAALDAAVAQSGRGMLVSPADRESGLNLNQEGFNTVYYRNAYRRPGYCWVQRKSTFDADNIESISPQPLTAFDIPAVKGVGDLPTTINDIVSAWLGAGTMAYEELNSEKVVLPVVERARKTRYELMVVGPGLLDGSIDLLTADQRATWNRIHQRFFIVDFLVPLLANLVLPNAQLDRLAEGLDDGLPTLIEVLGNKLPGIWEATGDGRLGDALNMAWQALTTDTSFQRAVLEWLLRESLAQIPETDGVTDLTHWQGAAGIAGSFLNVLSGVEMAAQALDTGVIVHNLAVSRKAALWTVDVIAPRITLTPTEGELADGDELEFTVTVQDDDGQLLKYHWRTAALHGHLTDWQGTQQDEFDSSRGTAKYLAGTAEGGQESISVEAFVRLENPSPEWVSIGVAGATLQVGLKRYTIAGTENGGIWNVDDDLDLYVNGKLKFTTYRGGAAPPEIGRIPFTFLANPHDVLRIVFRDEYGENTGCTDLWLLDEEGHSTLLVPTWNEGNRPHGDNGISFDQTFEVPF